MSDQDVLSEQNLGKREQIVDLLAQAQVTEVITIPGDEHGHTREFEGFLKQYEAEGRA